MGSWIKICGVTRGDDADLAVRLGADALGFVFHPPSPRCCPPDAARSIIANLPAHVASVGVWLDEDARSIAQTARSVGCSLIQTYNPATARELLSDGFAVIPAMDPNDLPQSRSVPDHWTTIVESSAVDKLIIDYGRRNGGQSPAKWSAADFDPIRGTVSLILAGALKPDNVTQALCECRPDGVDVASGVEAHPGRKDPAKLTRFIEEVRRWDAKAISDASADVLSPKQ